MAGKLQQLIDKYETWESIPDTEKPKDSKQLDKIKKMFEEGKKKAAAITGAKDNLLKNSSAGIANDKGDSSLKGNPGAVKLIQKGDEIGLKPDNLDTKVEMNLFRKAASEALKQMEGKTAEEQNKIADKVLGTENPSKTETAVEKAVEQKEEKPVEKKEDDKQTVTPEEEKQNAFLKSWAATHPSWAKILTSKDLSFGQKVQLVGSALANLGANVTLGAKAGFEHSGFQPIDWDFKKAVDKYTSNEIDSVLAGEQKNRTKVETADFWKNYRKIHGDDAADELIALADLYGDNPGELQNRLKAMGINASADEIKDLYSQLEKTTLSQEAKQKMLDTEAKRLENRIKELQAKVTGETAEKLIEAQNALNNFNNIKYSSDGKTYNIEKAGNYLKNILHEVEGVASTVGGVMTGGVVGGIPSK